MFIEEVLEIDNMVFKPQEDLKTPKYDKLEVWREGWESIDIGPYPTGNAVVKEIKKVQEEIKNANGETKQQYINCDEDASYYIKKYMDEHDLDYNDDIIYYRKYIPSNISQLNDFPSNKYIIKKIDLLGRETLSQGFQLHIYDDGSVDKKYIIK